MLNLKQKDVTLIGIDCDHPEQLIAAADMCERYCTFAETKLLTHEKLPDKRIIPIEKISSQEAYNFFVMKKLAEYVETDFALIIQYDGYIQNVHAWTDEFLKYDYIGAPWGYTGSHDVGNGGFSLRSKKLLDLLHDDPHIQKYYPEDRQICKTYRNYLEQRGITFAPAALADHFSIEGNNRWGFTWNGQFGFHSLMCTLGVKVPYRLKKEKLSNLVVAGLTEFSKTSYQHNVFFEYFEPKCGDTVEIEGESFRAFLRNFLFSPINRLTIDSRVLLTVHIVDSGEYLTVLVRQKNITSKVRIMRPPQAKKDPEDDGTIVLKATVPKKQRLFEWQKEEAVVTISEDR